MAADAPTPADIASADGFYAMSIRDLDELMDRLYVRARLLTETGGDCEEYAKFLVSAHNQVRDVRNAMLTKQYDMNRAGDQ